MAAPHIAADDARDAPPKTRSIWATWPHDSVAVAPFLAPSRATCSRANEENEPTGIEVGGLSGLIILIACIWAIVNVLASAASTGSKVLWVVVILVLPVIGLIAWLLMGPRKDAAGI